MGVGGPEFQSEPSRMIDTCHVSTAFKGGKLTKFARQLLNLTRWVNLLQFPFVFASHNSNHQSCERVWCWAEGWAGRIPLAVPLGTQGAIAVGLNLRRPITNPNTNLCVVSHPSCLFSFSVLFSCHSCTWQSFLFWQATDYLKDKLPWTAVGIYAKKI